MIKSIQYEQIIQYVPLYTPATRCIASVWLQYQFLSVSCDSFTHVLLGCLLPRHWDNRVVIREPKVALVHVGKVDLYHTWIKHIKAHILSIIGVSTAALYQESNVISSWLAGTDCKVKYVSVLKLRNEESGHLIKFQLPTFCVKSKCLKASTSFGQTSAKSTQNMPRLCHEVQKEPYQNIRYAWMKQKTYTFI